MLQAPEEYGQHSASIYRHFIAPLEEDKNAAIAIAIELAKVCRPVLKHGPSAQCRKEIDELLVRLGIQR